VVLDIEPIKTVSSDEDLKRLVFAPGLQRAGGMRVVHMLAEPLTDLLTTVTENGLYY